MATPKSPRNNQTQDELVERCGVQDWSEVVEWFGGKTVEQIKAEADRMWHGDDNTNFALRIYAELN